MASVAVGETFVLLFALFRNIVASRLAASLFRLSSMKCFALPPLQQTADKQRIGPKMSRWGRTEQRGRMGVALFGWSRELRRSALRYPLQAGMHRTFETISASASTSKSRRLIRDLSIQNSNVGQILSAHSSRSSLFDAFMRLLQSKFPRGRENSFTERESLSSSV